MSVYYVGTVPVPVTRRNGLRYRSLFETWGTVGPILMPRRDEFQRIVGPAPLDAFNPLPPWCDHPAICFCPQGCCHELAAVFAVWLRDWLGDGWQLVRGALHSNLVNRREGLVLDPLVESRGGSPSDAFSASRWRSVRIPLSKCGDDPVALILRTEGMARAA